MHTSASRVIGGSVFVAAALIGATLIAVTASAGSDPTKVGPRSMTAPQTSPIVAPIASNPIASSVTYNEGQIRFDPPAPTYVPIVSSSDAYQAFNSLGLYPEASTLSTPSFQLAKFTNYGNGSIEPTGAINPVHSGQPVWVITFANVPDQASGGANVAGAETIPPVTVLHNIVAIVDANSGTVLDVMSELPDSTAYPMQSAEP
jgi:hypothetical protein